MKDRAALLKQAEAKFPAYLRAVVADEAFFPLDLVIGRTRKARDYEERRNELRKFRGAAESLGLNVEWRTVQDRRFGPHDQPAAARFETESAYLKAIGKFREAEGFRRDLERIRASGLGLDAWAAAQPAKILHHADEWDRLLRVVAWFLERPDSGLYLRQLPIPGVDTKFIERHRRLIEDLLAAADGGEGDLFEARGVRVEEPALRLRFLDPAARCHCGLPDFAADLALPRDRVGRLDPPPGTRVLVVENLRNFLALPERRGWIAVFGSGDAQRLWRGVGWLESAPTWFWGDLDLHGLALLARLREMLPRVRGFLMRESLLDEFAERIVADETRAPSFDLARLDLAERRLAERLDRGRLRLEQERLPMALVEAELERCEGRAD